MTWKDTWFINWKVSPEEMQKRLPDELIVDTCDGSGWISIVSFTMQDMKLSVLGNTSPKFYFPELNLRTYVTHKGVPGIYFLSLDIPDMLPVTVARSWSGLNYRKRDVSLANTKGALRCSASNNDSNYFLAESKRAQKLTNTDVTKFLTDRSSFYTKHCGKILRGDIHHKPWQLHDCNTTIHKNTLLKEVVEVEKFSTPDISFIADSVSVEAFNLKIL